MEVLAKIESITMNARQYTRQSDGQTGFAHQVEMTTDSGRIGFEVFYDEEGMKSRGFVQGAVGTIRTSTRCRRYTDKYGNQRIATDTDVDARSWTLANKHVGNGAPQAQGAQREASQEQVAAGMAEAAAVAEAQINPETGLPF